uniref:Uncharacterized protein n=1 Tax=Tanacetum cinerariifolium TaxID=118510 RepID=A0A699HBU2_TANCI|nr:hypothetical protein [Tanacetum cinerariifolium]
MMSDMTAYLNDLSYIPLNNEQNEPTQGDISKTSNKPTQAICNKFEESYVSANEERYPGYKLPPSYYAIKEKFKTIGLGYESIHACVNDCFLFRGKDHKDKQFCPVCNTSRWKDSNTLGKKVPKKVLRYFSIIPRLHRLYKSSHTAKEMTWHATGKYTEPGKMKHPVDARAWKNFDTKYLDFAKEPRNVRLGLAADGFNPFKNLKSSFMLTLLIPGLKSPGKDIDVYLRPLIDDLNDLWAKPGVETIDVATGQKFNLRAMVLWTINDFPAQSSLSGWSGQGYKACPTCNEDTLSSDDMLKAQSKVVDILCNLELIYPPGFFDIMIHLIIHLPLEALEGGPIHPQWIQFPNKDTKEEFPGWFGSQIHQHHVDKDPSVSASSELFALACGPTLTPISVNSYVVNSVRFVVHSRDERRTTQNNDICSPGEDREIYYGQLEEILEFSYMSFKTMLFRVKRFDTSNKGRVKHLVIRNNITQILANEIAALHIYGQSIDVDAPPNIIDVDEDDGIIDSEDVLPHDLADSNDEDLVNVDDDSVAVVYSDVARGHGGNGGGDDRLPLHQLASGFQDSGKGTRKPNLGGRKAGNMHNCKETSIPPKWKAGVLEKIGTQFDLTPHLQSELWPEIKKDIDQLLGKIYTDIKSSLKRDYWVKNPDDEASNFGLIPRTWPSVLKMLETGQRARSYAGRDPGHLLPSDIGRCRASRLKSIRHLIQTFFDTHNVGGEEMLRLQGLGTYTDDQIMAMVRGGKQRRHILDVGRVLAGRGKDVLDVPMPRCNHTSDFQSQHESGSGAAWGDELGDDEDADEDEEDADSYVNICNLEKVSTVTLEWLTENLVGPLWSPGNESPTSLPDIFSPTTCRRKKVSTGTCRREKLDFVPEDSGKYCSEFT